MPTSNTSNPHKIHFQPNFPKNSDDQFSMGFVMDDSVGSDAEREALAEKNNQLLAALLSANERKSKEDRDSKFSKNESYAVGEEKFQLSHGIVRVGDNHYQMIIDPKGGTTKLAGESNPKETKIKHATVDIVLNANGKISYTSANEVFKITRIQNQKIEEPFVVKERFCEGLMYGANKEDVPSKTWASHNKKIYTPLPFVPGHNLKNHITQIQENKTTAPTTKEVVRFALELLMLEKAMQKKGIVAHGDFFTQNIMLPENKLENPRLLDWEFAVLSPKVVPDGLKEILANHMVDEDDEYHWQKLQKGTPYQWTPCDGKLVI